MRVFTLLFLLMSGLAQAQSPNSVGGGAAQPAPAAPAQGSSESSSSGQGPGESSKFLGKDVPFLDPGSNTVTWDGKAWNVANNRFFRARFEKYLSSAGQTEKDDREYQQVINAILDKLAPEQLTSKSVDEAWGLLPKASNFAIDAKLCDSLANAVYSVWLAKNENDRLENANAALERQRELLTWNASASVSDGSLGVAPSAKDAAALKIWQQEKQMTRDLRMQPYVARLADVETMLKANRLKREASELQSKIQFQALILDYFLQRRFQHVLMATRFYRVVYGDGDNKLYVGKESEQSITKISGAPPTLGVLDSLSSEAIRDVDEGVEAFNFLLDKKEMAGASDRLGEAFAVGEYMPSVRNVPREKKRQVLEFTRNNFELLSALEVKDYSKAEELVKNIQAVAKDFDASKPLAAIETARTVSSMHLSKARNAAVSGDRATLEAELKAATEIWPRNPELAKISSSIFSQADVQQQALVDLDRLISQKNYRQIFDDKVRYIAATALYPEKQQQLGKIMENMQLVESGIIRANEIAKAGNYAGAWESVEQVFRKFPDDNKLNQVRADLTTEAAEFVRSLRAAQQLEDKDQYGSSLAWYLKAQSLYPASEFAGEGVQRLVGQIMPDRK
ncbi:MAG: hypothetical protein PHD76_04290 [Methylacidiphilales bacterium]|nr:hypothetical protein [Candidatus Methylacidiphilales bacterium]